MRFRWRPGSVNKPTQHTEQPTQHTATKDDSRKKTQRAQERTERQLLLFVLLSLKICAGCEDFFAAIFRLWSFLPVGKKIFFCLHFFAFHGGCGFAALCSLRSFAAKISNFESRCARGRAHSG